MHNIVALFGASNYPAPVAEETESQSVSPRTDQTGKPGQALDCIENGKLRGKGNRLL